MLAVQWEDEEEYLWAQQFSQSLGNFTGRAEIKQKKKKGKETDHPDLPLWSALSRDRSFSNQGKEGGKTKRENKVYLPDSSLFRIYDEVHQGWACGHPERQETDEGWPHYLQIGQHKLNDSPHQQASHL